MANTDGALDGFHDDQPHTVHDTDTRVTTRARLGIAGRMSARWRVLVLLACALGCSSAVGAAAPSEPPLHHGALPDFVPAAGLRWLVVGSPRELAAAPALAPLRDGWLTEARRQAFARSTGIDLWQTERALAAGFELGTLYLADASGWVAPPEKPFVARLAGSERSEQPHPRIWRVSGVAGTHPETLVRVADQLVAVAVGDPTLARVVELRARGRLGRVVSALDGVSLAALPADLRRPGPLTLYVPGPLEEDWVADGTSLLGNTQALALTLELAGEHMTLGVALAGHWRPERDLPRLLETWDIFARTSLGRELTLDRPLEPTETAGSETLLRLRTQLAGDAFATGLARLLRGQLGDLTL